MTRLTDTTAKFDAFVDEHECLDRALSKLRGLLERRHDARTTIEALADLSDHVMTHFAHEEQDDGFFENVVDQAPRLQRRANALIQEHATMADQLIEIQQYASANGPCDQWWSDLNSQFDVFWKLFFLHERAEIDLVQEAFHDDIGAAD